MTVPFDLLVIDLDNTLYAADNGVFSRMDKRMTAFVADALQIGHDEADALRIRYWQEYGTTLRGLMLHHQIEPESFLHDVHDVHAHELLQANKQLDKTLAAIKVRKVIHTNGIREHAERILTALDVRHHFDVIYDIRYRDYMPKPCAITLKKILEEEHVLPERTLVLDDMEENLAVAKKLGARTCWVSPEERNHEWDYKISKVEQLAVCLVA